MSIPWLSVHQGSFCALVAKSGAGKSVLLSVLTGHLLTPWMRKGSAIRYRHFRVGHTLVEPCTFASPARLRAALRAENLVYLPQKFPDDRSMRRSCRSEMADVVCAIALDCPRRTATEKLVDNCRKFHLEPLLEQPLKDLSGGERKRLEIIARLTGIELRDQGTESEDVLFLLDEPTTGLDEATQREFFLFLKRTRELFGDVKITFIIATHALSLLDDQTDAQPIFDSVLYVRKNHSAAGGKKCEVAYCGDAAGFVRTACFTGLNGRGTSVAEPVPGPRPPVNVTLPAAAAAIDLSPAPPRHTTGSFSSRLSIFIGELHRAFGKQFLGKGKRAVFVIPFLVGLIVFAAFLARKTVDSERFIFFSTIYAFWIGIFNSCQIVNGAVASGEWNYWVLALRRSFFSYLSANTLVSFLLSLVQVTVFALAVLLFTAVWPHDSLFNVFVTTSQLPVYFIESVVGIPPGVVSVGLLFASLIMAAFAGAGLGTLVSSIAKDTLGALKIAVGAVVVCMVASTTVLRGESVQPVMPPLFLKLTCPAPLFSAPATLSASDKVRHAGFCPHLLEDLSLMLPQRYFFNIGRILDRKALEYYDTQGQSNHNKDFEYQLTSPLADQWENWKEAYNPTKVAELRAELAESSQSFNEGGFVIAMLTIIGLEAAACAALAGVFFLAGSWITLHNRDNYEIH